MMVAFETYANGLGVEEAIQAAMKHGMTRRAAKRLIIKGLESGELKSLLPDGMTPTETAAAMEEAKAYLREN